jgi:hypothetical protein
MTLAGDKLWALVLSQWARDVTTANRTKLFVNGKRALFGNSLKLLGVQFDRLLHFGGHCTALNRRVWPRIAQLRKNTVRSWGLDETHIRAVASGYVRGAMKYAAGAWLPAASNSHREVLDPLNNAVARVDTGCPRSTP